MRTSKVDRAAHPVVGTTPPTQDELADFVRLIIKGYKRFGSSAIDSKLREIVSRDKRTDELKKEILSQVARAYNCSIPDIINSGKRGDVSCAKVMTILLFNDHLGLASIDIARIFNKDKSLVAKRIRIFRQYMNGGVQKTQSSIDKMYFNKEFVTLYRSIGRRIVRKYPEVGKTKRILK